MKTKQCNKCFETKTVNAFSKRKDSKDGFRNGCKSCRLVRDEKYFSKNSDKLEERKVYQKQYRDSHKQRTKEYNKMYREQNIDTVRAKQREYANANKTKRNKYQRERRHSSPTLRLKQNISSVVNRAIKKVSNGNAIKGGSTFEHLPYTPQQLKEHIENQFEDWMNWDNWGKWHIDHITPQSALLYDSLKHPNFQKCWALENLCPLSAEDNIYKSNKY
jgi:hypothetical protein